MGSTKLAFLAIMLLQALWCALSQDYGNTAVMSLTSFEGDDPSACDGQELSDGDAIVALSTQWFNGGSMCQQYIYITDLQVGGGRVRVKVVDECDTQMGCRDNMIAASQRVWDALLLDTGLGEVPVTWTRGP